MKSLLLLAMLAQGGAPASLPATDVNAKDIQAAVAQAKATGRDTPVRVIDVGGQHLAISMTFRERGRSAGGGSHATITEVYQVLEGAATFVTGGTSVRRTDGGFPIQGGVSRRIAKGDVVIIPPGTPHGISDVLEDITIIVVRIDAGRTLKLQ